MAAELARAAEAEAAAERARLEAEAAAEAVRRASGGGTRLTKCCWSYRALQLESARPGTGALRGVLGCSAELSKIGGVSGVLDRPPG